MFALVTLVVAIKGYGDIRSLLNDLGTSDPGEGPKESSAGQSRDEPDN